MFTVANRLSNVESFRHGPTVAQLNITYIVRNAIYVKVSLAGIAAERVGARKLTDKEAFEEFGCRGYPGSPRVIILLDAATGCIPGACNLC